MGAVAILGCAALVGSSGVAGAGPPDPAGYAADPHLAVRWNQLALQTTATEAISPAHQTRTLAIVQTAVLDAVVAAENGGRPYSLRIDRPNQGSNSAATVAAAHDTLLALHPERRQLLDAAFADDLGKLPDDRYTRDGLAIGRAAAAGILALRAADGFSAPATTTRSGSGSVAPFVLDAADQLRPEPPPALDSRTYARDYDEVRSVGAVDSSVRTAAQTDTARLWRETAPQHWNRIVQQLAVDRRLSLVQTAETFALLNLAGVDAFVAAHDAGSAFARPLPVAAIHAAGAGVAPPQPTDPVWPVWSPLLATASGSEYPAFDAVYAGAAETVLTALFGKQPGTLIITSDATPGVIRKHADFQAVAAEVIDAQVWGGTHWRSSGVAGRKLGHRIGSYVLADGLRPGPSTLPPVRDPGSGRLLDRPDRWVPRGPVITTP